MYDADFPEIDPSMLDPGSPRDEPRVVLWSGRRAVALAQPTARDVPPALDPTAAPIDWTKLRRQSPCEYLLPATRAWANALPGDVVPHALMRHFARIANQLCHLWDRRPDFRAYLYDDLLADRRGGRRGFPPEVLHDLLRLREHCDTLDIVAAGARPRQAA